MFVLKYFLPNYVFHLLPRSIIWFKKLCEFTGNFSPLCIKGGALTDESIVLSVDGWKWPGHSGGTKLAIDLHNVSDIELRVHTRREICLVSREKYQLLKTSKLAFKCF